MIAWLGVRKPFERGSVGKDSARSIRKRRKSQGRASYRGDLLGLSERGSRRPNLVFLCQRIRLVSSLLYCQKVCYASKWLEATITRLL